MLKKTAILVALIVCITLFAIALVIAGTFAPDPQTRASAWSALGGFAGLLVFVIIVGFFFGTI